MLLNQCLAISLSQVATGHNVGMSGEQVGALGVREQAGANKTDGPASGEKGSIGQASASGLFRQIVELNAPDSGADGARLALSKALQRVEFAGFVLPSWLLLSGTYDDLHCIKTSWANGSLKSSPSLRVETIGE